MSKFKRGDKVRLKPNAENWSIGLHERVFVVSDDLINGYCSDSVLDSVKTYEYDFELVESSPVPHVHHDMIIEWAKNPSRVVECKSFADSRWNVIEEPSWYPENEYRFKPEEPERVFPETSLSGDEIQEIYNAHQVGHWNAMLVVANAAIKRYILDQEKDLTA